MVATEDNLIGIGVYTPSEAATYARISPQTMRRWLYGSPQGERVTPSQLPSEEKVVTFLDFVQALAIHDIRTQHKVPLSKIREAAQCATKKYKVEYPFARQHSTYLLNGEILIRLDEDEDLTQVTGKHANQMTMRKIVELYLKDLTFGANGLATAYKAYSWDSLDVSMNPRRRFGEPLVESSGYTAQALLQAFRTEGSFEAAAQAYGVDPRQVELAYRYYDYLQGKTAA
jgi:uncharacterized protein (DUF433 family)